MAIHTRLEAFARSLRGVYFFRPWFDSSGR